MRELAWIVVVALTGLTLPSLALQQTTTPAFAQQSVYLDVDAIAAGNSADAVGSINKTVQRRVGESFEVDVAVQNARDLLGFGFDFTFDPSVVHVTRVNVNMLLASEPESSVADFTKNFAAPEDVDGLITPAAADFAQGAAASSRGSGVLVRVTFVAASCGASPLTVTPNSILGPILQDSRGELFNPPAVDGAQILVDSSGDAKCPVPGDLTQPPGTSSPLRPQASANEGAETANGVVLSEGAGQEKPESEGQGRSSEDASAAVVGPTPASNGTDVARDQSQAESDDSLRWAVLVGIPTALAVAACAIGGRMLWRRRR